MPFDRGDRTYYVSDERLKAFRALPVEEKLRWVEEMAMFLRLAQPGETPEAREPDKSIQTNSIKPPSA